jgi:hypothetical protein
MEGPTSKKTKEPPKRAHHKGNLKKSLVLIFLGYLLETCIDRYMDI